MNKLRHYFALLIVACVTVCARAQTTQPTDFAVKLDLSELRALSLQDRQTIKTWDTFARQIVSAVTGQTTLDGHEPLFTVLDIAFRPEAYVDRNILKIKNVPLRKDFAGMPGLAPAEAKRILEDGTVSLSFWSNPDTQIYLRKLQQEAVWKSEAINTVQGGANALNNLMEGGPSLKPMSFVPPASTDGNWLNLTQLSGNIAQIAQAIGVAEVPPTASLPPPVEGYDELKLAKVFAAFQALHDGWLRSDSTQVQTNINALVASLPDMEPSAYPSAAKRHAEVIYNKLYKLTLPGAAVYFIAFTLFLIAAYSPGGSIRTWGVGFMIAGLLLHATGVFIRWWIDQKSTGSWFYSIPIKNQFESVMMSALFGVIVGLSLEIWKKKSLFGAAASFVGWMSLIALFTVPYVFGKDIGGEIGRSQGILMSYWLYIHVTLATASYSLIGMSFLLGVWWMLRYATAPKEVQALRGNLVSSDAQELRVPIVMGKVQLAGAGASVDYAADQGQLSRSSEGVTVVANEQVRSLLARLDAANLVILQLAFWILATAIVCGAKWADVSWGRPWGWDPKETFALVTWIVYLIVIHVRLVTNEKAFWTAVLTIVGFFVMLFNWIGVNYFLVGLHSYA